MPGINHADKAANAISSRLILRSLYNETANKIQQIIAPITKTNLTAILQQHGLENVRSL